MERKCRETDCFSDDCSDINSIFAAFWQKYHGELSFWQVDDRHHLEVGFLLFQNFDLYTSINNCCMLLIKWGVGTFHLKNILPD